MLLNKLKLRKASSRVALLLATGSLLATGISPANAADATPLYLNFETADPLKALSVSAQGPFGGVTTEIKAGTNLTTGDALHITKPSTALVYGAVNILLPASTPFKYTDATNKFISFNYWSPLTVPSPVMLKLEGGGAAIKTVEAAPGLNNFSVDMSTGTGWNATAPYNTFVIFPNFTDPEPSYTGAAAAPNAGEVYEIDNISINGGTAADIYVPVVVPPRAATSTLLTFETGDTLGAAAAGPGFDGAVGVIKDAPAGGNGGKALEIEKAGAEWASLRFVTAPSGVKFLDVNKQTVTMNYYSPETANNPVQLKLVATDGSSIHRAVQAVPGWQTLTFDFSDRSNAAKEYTEAIIIPNFVNNGEAPGYTGALAVLPNTGKKYFVDNVGFNGAATPAIPTPPAPRVTTSTLLTFESADTLGAKAVGESGGAKLDGSFEGAISAIVDAPTGGNGGKALEVTKAGTKAWSGVNLVSAPAGVKFDKVVTLNYYSPETVKTPVMMHLIAEGGGYIGIAIEANPGWQKLTFDFTTKFNVAKEYTRVAMFPNFVNADDVPGYTGAPAVAAFTGKKYYIDNVGFNGAATPAIPTPVVKVKPTLKTAATATGTAKVAKTLTAGKGSWTGTATIAYTYKWLRCTVASTKAATTATATKCSTISGATKTTYKLASADVGKYVRVLVTAKNSAGTAYSLSKTTSKVVK